MIISRQTFSGVTYLFGEPLTFDTWQDVKLPNGKIWKNRWNPPFPYFFCLFWRGVCRTCGYLMFIGDEILPS